MKKYAFFALFLSFALVSFAQTTEKSDPKATALLDKVKAQYDAYKSLEAEFTLDIEVPGQKAVQQKGTLSQEGEKFRLVMPSQTLASNGKATWIYLPENNEIQINDVDPDDETGLLTPKDLLNQYKKGDYLYAITSTEKTKDGLQLQVEFKPKDRDSDYSKIRVGIDKQTNQIKVIKAFAKDGSRYTFSVVKLTPNKKFAEKHFQLDPKDYDGAHVEDLRF